MPTLKIDDVEITVEPGTRVIEAADRLGIDIPRFCYHPGLSVAANCRMCLVETNRSPKLVPSCYETCCDGLEVKTRSGKVLEARRAVLEYILLNHPVDCPICDQAGECDLQDLYFAHDHQPSRHEFRKLHKPKARILGPQIVYDGERCINCTRCIRVCDEVAKSPQLQQVQRGERTYIDVFPGMELDHAYSMCTADVCPVGALTTRDFRFKCRAWFTHGTQSVCAECSRGCSVRIDVYRNEVQRVVPRENPQVNQFWACDAGRLAYHAYEKDRLAVARVRGEAGGPAEALDALARGLAALPPDARVLVVLSPTMTIEDAWAAIWLFRGRPGTVRFAVGGRAPGAHDDILIRADKAPNRAGLTYVLGGLGAAPVPLDPALAGDPTAIVVFGDDHAATDALIAAMGKAQVSAAFVPRDGALAAAAGVALPVLSPYETDGVWVNEFGVAQRVRGAVTPAGDTRSVPEWLAELGARLGDRTVAATPALAFAQAAAAIPAFSGLSLEGIGPHGIVLK
jgi:NADH-quinone oxidoreductase subunit G